MGVIESMTKILKSSKRELGDILGRNNFGEFLAEAINVLIGVKNWQSRMWKLIRRLTEFANNPSTSWPSPDRGDYLAANANFMNAHAKIIEQVHHHYCDSFVLSAVIANLQKLTTILL
ncbi:hypothetical protein ACTXT7_015321, partial [Hymenolepis weldensis]